MSVGKKTTLSEADILLSPSPQRRRSRLHRRVEDRTVRMVLGLAGAAFVAISSVVLWRETYGATENPAIGLAGESNKATPWVLLGGAMIAWLSIVANI